MSQAFLYIGGLVLSIGHILLILRIARYIGITYISSSEIELFRDGYWCVVCGRFLPANSGVIVHDNVPHPPTMTFDDEERPQ